jgi:hypothetical protein
MGNKIIIKVFNKEFELIEDTYTYILDQSCIYNRSMYKNKAYTRHHLSIGSIDLVTKSNENLNELLNEASKVFEKLIINKYLLIKDFIPEVENYITLKEII